MNTLKHTQRESRKWKGLNYELFLMFIDRGMLTDIEQVLPNASDDMIYKAMNYCKKAEKYEICDLIAEEMRRRK